MRRLKYITEPINIAQNWYVNRQTNAPQLKLQGKKTPQPKCIWKFMIKSAFKESEVTKKILLSIVGITG